MIIDLSKRREDYFADSTPREILERIIQKDGPITIKDVHNAGDEDKVVIATSEGTVESLVQGQYHVDSEQTVRKISSLRDDQILILPEEYRIDAEEARTAVVYDVDNLVRLDSKEVLRALLGDVTPNGPLSAARKQQEEWAPEKVIKTAFELLHEHKEENIERRLSCYSWWGKDKHRRVVSLYRAIQGTEIRAFQNFAAYKLLILQMKKELRKSKSAASGYKVELTAEEKEKRELKVKRYEAYLNTRRPEGKTAGSYIRRMDVDFSDLIEVAERSFGKHSGKHVNMPSRANPGKEHKHNSDVTGLPLFENDDPRSYSAVWEIRGHCDCDDKRYRSNRRRADTDKGNDEDFFCAHEIAATYALRKINERKSYRIEHLPFVMPTAKMMDYVHRLRHQTLLVKRNSETGKLSKRTLNHSEMENLLWKKVIADGYESCFTADIHRFRKEGYDPHLHLIRFLH